MRKERIGLVLLLIILTSQVFLSEQIYLIYTQKGEEITVKELAKSLQSCDVVFIGEFHGNSANHRFQQDILPFLSEEGKAGIAISMEMFERDVQETLNAYLGGKITRDQFIEKARPWPNYPKDYEPLIEFAKKHSIPVIAANVPRRIASHLVKTGNLSSIGESERKYHAKKHNVWDDEYKKRFYQTISSIKHPEESKQPEQENDFLYRMYQAQCLKDDTMAESMHSYLLENPGILIVHFNGDFHSNSWLGTADRLRKLDENLNICVVSPVLTESPDDIEFIPEYSGAGDFILFVTENNKDS